MPHISTPQSAGCSVVDPNCGKGPVSARGDCFQNLCGHFRQCPGTSEQVSNGVLGGASAIGSNALGNVTRNFRRSDNMPPLFLGGGNGQRNVERGAVLSAVYRLVTNDTLAPADPFHNFPLFTLAIRRDQNADRFARNFSSRGAKEPFRFFVPTRDRLIEIDTYDRVSGGPNDRSQAAVSFFGALLLGDVAEVGRKNWRPIDLSCVDRKRHQNLGTIPAQGRDFDQLSQQWALASFQIVSQPLSMSLAKSRRANQAGQFLANRFSARKTEYPLGGRVEFADAPGRVHRDDAIERRVEESATESLQRCSWTSYIISLVLLR